MKSYVKSLSADFSGNLNSSKFHFELDEDPSIGISVIGVNVELDIVTIMFNDDLSASEEIALTTRISLHTPDTEIITDNFQTIIPYDTSIKTSSYKAVSAFAYEGSNNVSTIVAFKILSLMDETTTSYGARIYDVTNDNILCEATLTNEELQLNDLGTVSNIPSERAILELHVKKIVGANKDIKVYELKYYW